MSFHNKTILLIGANSALGQPLAKQLCKLGSKVALVDRDEAALLSLQTEINQVDSEVICIANDFLEEDAATEVVAQAIKTFGKIDLLINVACHLDLGPFQASTPAQLAQEMYNHAILPMMFCHAVLPSMVQQESGQIANIGDFYSTLGQAETARCAANSQALKAFSEALQREVVSQGIKVSFIATNPIKTSLLDNTLHEKLSTKPIKLESPVKSANMVLEAIHEGSTISYPDKKSYLLTKLNSLSPRLAAYLMRE